MFRTPTTRRRIFLSITAGDFLYFIAMLIYLGATNRLVTSLSSDVFSGGGNFQIAVWLNPASETATPNFIHPS